MRAFCIINRGSLFSGHLSNLVVRHQPASPGTQDAIQGMLSISLPGRSSTSPHPAYDDDDDDEDYDEEDGDHESSGPRRGSRRRVRKRYADELEDDLPNCFQDAKYGK